MSETRFFKDFPSFTFKALAKILLIGFRPHTSTPYVSIPAYLRADYLGTTRAHYAQVPLPTRDGGRSRLPEVLAAVDAELRENPVEVALDRPDGHVLGVRDLTVGVALFHQHYYPALGGRQAGSARGG